MYLKEKEFKFLVTAEFIPSAGVTCMILGHMHHWGQKNCQYLARCLFFYQTVCRLNPNMLGAQNLRSRTRI